MSISNSKGHVLSEAEIEAALAPVGVRLSPLQSAQVLSYTELLIKWNKMINLTTIVNPHEILVRHFAESMFAGQFCEFSGGRLADVGSGAGFPGLAIKIMAPWLRVSLVDSNLKKSAFLKELVRLLHLEQVSVIHSNYSSCGLEARSLEFVTARAIGQLTALLRWSKGVLNPTGAVLLWLGANDATMLSHDERWIWQGPHPIPGSARRVLLIGRPTSS